MESSLVKESTLLWTDGERSTGKMKKGSSESERLLQVEQKVCEITRVVNLLESTQGEKGKHC